MSLINEALKRAEAEKLTKAGMQDTAPLPPSVPDRPRSAKGPALVAILTAVAIAAAVAAGVSLLRRLGATPRPGIAAGVPSQQPAQVGAAMERAEPDATLAPGAVPAAAIARVPKEQAKPADALGETRAPETAEMEAFSAVRDQTEDTSSGTAQPIARQPAEPATQPDVSGQTRAETGTFQLSGIMSGPGGDAALINGQIVEVGQTIDGAKLVRVLNQAVELQLGDRQFILRM